MQTTLPLRLTSKSATDAFLAQHGFFCPVYNATLTMAGCAGNRSLPYLEQSAVNLAPGEERRERNPRCTDDCPIYLKALGDRPKGPWQLIMEATGCDTQEKLAKKLKTYQSKVSQFMVKLANGREPVGPVWEKLLDMTGLTAAQLLQAAKAQKPKPDKALEALQREEKPEVQGLGVDLAAVGLGIGHAELSRVWVDNALVFDANTPPPADASPASSPPQPSGPAASSAGPGGALAAQEMPGQAPPVLAGGAAPVGAILGGSVACELLAKRLAETPDPATAPADFELYTPGRVYEDSPRLTIYVDGTFGFSSEAVRDLGIDKYQYAQLLYSRARGQIGIKLLHEQAEASLKIQHPHPDKRRRTLTARGFMRQYGLDLKARRLPLHVDQSGLLVASIDNTPAPGGEG